MLGSCFRASSIFSLALSSCLAIRKRSPRSIWASVRLGSSSTRFIQGPVCPPGIVQFEFRFSPSTGRLGQIWGQSARRSGIGGAPGHSLPAGIMPAPRPGIYPVSPPCCCRHSKRRPPPAPVPRRLHYAGNTVVLCHDMSSNLYLRRNSYTYPGTVAQKIIDPFGVRRKPVDREGRALKRSEREQGHFPAGRAQLALRGRNSPSGPGDPPG